MSQFLYGGALAVALSFGTPLPAQPVSSPGLPVPVPQQTFTTGMVGFATNQMARLNVFNLNPAPLSTASPQALNCSISLEFFDSKGGLASHTTVSSFAPGQTASLDFPYSSLTTESSVHAEIRGAVIINPTVTPAPAVTPGSCAVFTTLEIFDLTTGSTVALTSDTRLVGLAGVILPVLR